MFHTGLGKYRKATVDNFTSDIGIKIRRIFLGKFWRRILKLCTKRKIIIEQYPYLDKNEVYVYTVFSVRLYGGRRSGYAGTWKNPDCLGYGTSGFMCVQSDMDSYGF